MAGLFFQNFEISFASTGHLKILTITTEALISMATKNMK